MPGVNMIIIATFVILGTIVAILWRKSRNAASILTIAGIVVVAAIVMMVQVNQYRSQQVAAEADAADAARADAQAVDNTPPAPPPLTVQTPTMRGLTGGAAPAAARNPNAKS